MYSSNAVVLCCLPGWLLLLKPPECSFVLTVHQKFLFSHIERQKQHPVNDTRINRRPFTCSFCMTNDAVTELSENDWAARCPQVNWLWFLYSSPRIPLNKVKFKSLGVVCGSSLSIMHNLHNFSRSWIIHGSNWIINHKINNYIISIGFKGLYLIFCNSS